MIYIFLILVLLIVMTICLLLMLLPTDNQLKYMLWNSINRLPFTDSVKENIYLILIDFITKIRNRKIMINNQIAQETNNDNIQIKIPLKKDRWYHKIKDCSTKGGTIEDIYYDEIIKPSKSSITLY